MREWTLAQRAAIEARGKTLLVSAAAGSGKTAVLTERIIRTLTDKESPADISRLLVVTFTRAAAGELRQRITAALSEALASDPSNKHLAAQLVLISGASISTIDSFYLELVRAHFEEAGFPAAFRPADDNELLSLRREIMNDTVDRMYTENTDFPRVADVFCDLRHESSLTDTLLDVYEQLMRYPEGTELLTRSAEEMEKGASDPLDTAWGKVWLGEVQKQAARGQRLFAAAVDGMEQEAERLTLQRKYGTAYNEVLQRCREITERAEFGDYVSLRGSIAAPFACSLGTQKTPDCSDGLLELIAACEAFRKGWKDTVLPLAAFHIDEVEQSALESAAILRLLYKALSAFDTEYRASKMQREVAEFSDISRAAFRLLVSPDGTPTPLASEIAAKYDAVYIDEYQDVDAMQDATFRAISTPTNRFMVGDIKQSIYRFRGAQPAVFAHYRHSFPSLEKATENDPAATVFMSDCFRCDESIIKFSNAVSGHLFSMVAQSIGYTAEDDLRFSKKKPTPDYQSPKCRVVLIDRDKEAKDDGNPELCFIADEIARLLTSGRKADGTPIRPADIAVLARSTTHLSKLERELAARGIPAADTSRQNFFENSDVLCVYSLLAALDNPMRDVYLAAALRSPFFGFTLEDLVHVRQGSDASLSLYGACKAAVQNEDTAPCLRSRLSDFFARFTLWREKAQTLPVDRLLRYLYRESAILSFAGRKGDENTPTTRRANLRRLYEYARTFEAGGFKGLYQFIRYVDGIMENKGTMPAPDASPDAVSLITIHHSKGLEFPVCFLAFTASEISTKDTQPVLLCDEHLGCAPRLPNAGPLSRANTFFREGIALSLREQSLEEEMRVLYVAMTRARERLYVTACPSRKSSVEALMKKVAPAAATPQGAFITQKGPAYIHWILTALLACDHSDFAEIETVREAELKPLYVAADNTELAPNTAKREEISALLRQKFAYRYPHAHRTRLPAKLSVSRLSPSVLDVYDAEAATPDAVRDADAEQLLHSFERIPLFMGADSEKDAALRGTATHEFLQFCDFERTAREGVASELSRLIEARYLAPQAAELIREDELEQFFKSGLYRDLQQATELYRETRFHIFLPASAFTNDPDFAEELEDERLAVQGVIDLFYRTADGNWILCDYKTDRLTAAEKRDPSLAAAKLTARYKQQLSYYAQALCEICGKAPERILIYSLPLGEAIEVKLS